MANYGLESALPWELEKLQKVASSLPSSYPPLGPHPKRKAGEQPQSLPTNLESATREYVRSSLESWDDKILARRADRLGVSQEEASRVEAKPVSWVGLPIDAADRKKKPIYSGVIKYFPDALIGVAEVSYDGNEQHNPGTELHWDRSKSKDQRDALVRHLIESDPDTGEGLYAAKQVAWRALADLQLKIERMRNANTKG